MKRGSRATPTSPTSRRRASSSCRRRRPSRRSPSRARHRRRACPRPRPRRRRRCRGRPDGRPMHAAVFVDFENLFASLQNRAELSGQRTRELALSILENLVRRLQEEDCPLVLGRSYAAFDTFPGMEVAHALALMGFDPQYVLVSPAGKNSADVQLAVDVCRVLFRRPDIEAIVIVSGDRDFIPIARQVLEENRELRLVAIPDVASGDLRMRVGGERFWNALDLLPPVARRGPVPAESAGSAAEHAPQPEPE